jgi:hypothetical protein
MVQGLALLADMVASPRAALRRIRAAVPLRPTIVLLGAGAAGLAVLQSFVLAAAVAHDPELAELPDAGQAARNAFWASRCVAVLVAPLGLVLRALVLAKLLQAGTGALGALGTWRPLLSLALHLEIVLVLEMAAVLLGLVLQQPASLAELQSVPLRAGLDLVWEPGTPRLAALAGAANLFSVWWAVLLVAGLVVVRRTPWRQAVALGTLCWVGLVAVRWWADPR